MTHWTPVFKGIATYIPGLYAAIQRRKPVRSGNASYYYELWLKHLTLMWQNGMRRMPGSLAEFGPGQSLGLGIAALLSGVEHYYALDVVLFESPEKSLAMLDAMIGMFRQRAGIIRNHSPDFRQHLDGSGFPSHILTEQQLDYALAPERIERIRSALMQRDRGDDAITVRYVAPWNDPAVIAAGSIDVIISHTVMEYVPNLENIYSVCRQWLKPGGWMSHQIDFSSHDITEAWNGTWAYSDAMWKLAIGRRPYFLNRQPCSRHLELISRYGFDLHCSIRHIRHDGLHRDQLTSRWQHLADDDLNCAGLFVQASKPGTPAP